MICNENWILYDNQQWPDQWLDWEEAPKHFPKPNLHQKKTVTVTAWWSAACLIHCSFLNPGKTITSEKCAQPVDEMHQKLRCLQPALVNRKGRVLHLPVPSCTLHSQCFQSCTNWAAKFCLICHIHLTSRQPTTTSSSISTNFAGKTLPQPAGGRKCFPRVRRILEHGYLCCRSKQTYFSLAKICWL